MIKVLKETPITVGDKDYCLQLLYDDTMWFRDVCELCYYRDWNGYEECCASCCEVHGCNPVKPYYFKLTDL